MGAEIGVGALLGAAAISAVGSVAGAGISAAGASSLNEDTMDFNREEAEKARQFQREMYGQQLSDQQMMFDKNLSPQALARQYGKIGVNPSAVFGSGKSGFSGSLPSIPSVPSGSAAAISGLQNPMEYFADALKGTTGDAVSVLNAITDKNLKDKQALKVLAEKANLDVQNGILRWQDMINHTVGSEKAKQELNSIVEQVGLLAAQKNYYQAQQLVADTILKLNNKEFDIKDEELSQLKLRGTFLEADLNNSLEYQRETIKTEKSKQRSNFAAANSFDASALESKTRTVGIEFDNAIKRVDSENAAATAQQRLAALREQLMRDSNISRQQRLAAEAECEKLDKKLEMYRKHPSKAALDETLDNFNEHFPILGGFIKAFAK